MYPQVANLINEIIFFFEEHKEKLGIEHENMPESTIRGYELFKIIIKFVKKESAFYVDYDNLDTGIHILLSQSFFVRPTDEALDELNKKFIAMGENRAGSTTINIIAASLYECSWGQLSLSSVEENFNEAIFDAYEKYSIIRNTLNITKSRVESVIQQKERETLEKFNKRSQDKIEELVFKFTEENTNTLKIETEKQINFAKEQIAKHRKEVGATLVVENAHDLWKKKSESHKKAYYISSLIFIAVVVFSIGVPVFYWTSLFNQIKDLDQLFANHVFGGVLLLLIPVLGVAWILRLVSRFAVQNMTLADDAEIRKVMAETYVKLVSQEGAMDPHDRAIILTALFRPLPGSHGEDVSPPSIADIVKQGSNTASRPS
ncbi:hypothetical protein IWQ51_001730 [Labrenzia sp. EL_142]|nr:hypothetical protein [Labrenzia sp. EL_142]